MSKLHDNTVTQGIHPLACLLRGFAVDFITGHNLDVVERIMAPEYCLSIGGYLLNGRDTEYLPPTAAQINQFPGLTEPCMMWFMAKTLLLCNSLSMAAPEPIKTAVPPGAV